MEAEANSFQARRLLRVSLAWGCVLPGDSSAADQLLRPTCALGIADLLQRSRLRPKDDDAYYPSQPIPQSEDMKVYCETVSIACKLQRVL